MQPTILRRVIPALWLVGLGVGAWGGADRRLVAGGLFSGLAYSFVLGAQRQRRLWWFATAALLVSMGFFRWWVVQSGE